jgi:hypothetical protein
MREVAGSTPGLDCNTAIVYEELISKTSCIHFYCFEKNANECWNFKEMD